MEYGKLAEEWLGDVGVHPTRPPLAPLARGHSSPRIETSSKRWLLAGVQRRRLRMIVVSRAVEVDRLIATSPCPGTLPSATHTCHGGVQSLHLPGVYIIPKN